MPDLTASSSNFITGGIRRGDYMSVTGEYQYAETTSGLARSRRLPYMKQVRVIDATATVLTTRDRHRFAVVEWCHARAEDCMLWPLADFKARMRVRADA